MTIMVSYLDGFYGYARPPSLPLPPQRHTDAHTQHVNTQTHTQTRPHSLEPNSAIRGKEPKGFRKKAIEMAGLENKVLLVTGNDGSLLSLTPLLLSTLNQIPLDRSL